MVYISNLCLLKIEGRINLILVINVRGIEGDFQLNPEITLMANSWGKYGQKYEQ